jgi:hypothetical protein
MFVRKKFIRGSGLVEFVLAAPYLFLLVACAARMAAGAWTDVKKTHTSWTFPQNRSVSTTMATLPLLRQPSDRRMSVFDVIQFEEDGGGENVWRTIALVRHEF